MINNNDNNYSYSILCFQRALQLVHYVIFNLGSGSCAMSISFVCLNVFIERETSEERGGVRELEFSSSYITATWGCWISMWKVKTDNELERRMTWEGGEERPG